MIDVVVPIYGNPQLLRRCVESVYEHGSAPFRLILIDDASPDPAMSEVLTELGRHPAAVVFRNRSNRGFVATVNRAFRMSRHDVVILNSDTIVTRGWLEKLRACAHSQPGVATVTPLTNNGTICAVPEWLQQNIVPPGYRLAEYAELIENLSARSYPEIPTGVGFCMYITREAITAVGYFDQVTFHRGYGEENDFCMRAAALGYRHLLDDATFVYHEGGESFGVEKAALYERNHRALREKHPHYHDRVATFISEDPLRDIRASIRDAIAGRPLRRLRILLLLHELPGAVGGTEAHTRDLISSVGAADLLIAHPSPAGFVVEEYRQGKCVSQQQFSPAEDGKARSRDWYRSFLSRLRVQVVHVQHFSNHDPAVLGAASDLGIPIVFVWHDYFLLCPSYTLVNDRGRFCDWCRDLAECDRCLAGSAGYPSGFQREWRRVSDGLIGKVDAHVFPSAAALGGARSIFNLEADKVHVIPHGRDLPADLASHRHDPSAPLRVAFLGARTRANGADLFRTIVRRSGGLGIEWHAFGAAPAESSGEVIDGVCDHGPYEREAIPGLLREAGIDLVLLLSIWPETFSYTLSEAWGAGIPVLGSSLGAIGERIRATGGGWIVDVDEPDEIVTRLRTLRMDRSGLGEKADRARAVGTSGLDEMARAYGELYRRLTERTFSRAEAATAVPASARVES